MSLSHYDVIAGEARARVTPYLDFRSESNSFRFTFVQPRKMLGDNMAGHIGENVDFFATKHSIRR